MSDAALRLGTLRRQVREFPSALLGFSGGVDSALLAVVLRQELGRDRVVAAVGRSASLPAAQAEQARALAREFDVPLLEVETRELHDPNYLANPTNRCFFCKTELWSRLGAVARTRGIAVVCDGTNAADLREHRPGHAAGLAAAVRSPLADAGLTKADVRAAARELGLPNWDAPAAPCLSSRVRYGLQITPLRLEQVEAGEAYLRRLGIRGDLRVRHLGDLARVEVEPEWIPWVAARMDDVRTRLRALGFDRAASPPGLPARGAARRAACRPLGVRLFVALNFPDAVREALWRAAAPLRGLDLPVKWVRPDGLHLTLKFLGEVPDEREADLGGALARVAGPGTSPRPLALDLRGFGAFPGLERPRVFWAGIEPAPALELLQHRVEEEFAPLGFPTEARAFRPHLTLGRAARDARPADLRRASALVEGLAHEASAMIETVESMQSTLRSSGAVYQVRQRERLS